MPCTSEINSNDRFNRGWGILLFNHSKHIFTTAKPLVTKLRVVACLEEFLFIKLHDPLITWYFAIAWQIKYVIFPLALDQWPPNMGGKVVTYLEGLLPIKLVKPLNTWSRKVTLQIKIIKSPLSQCLWSSNLSR